MTVIDNLSAFYVTMYNNKTASLNLLFESGVAKEVFLTTYKNFVREQLLTPIEELPEEEKKMLVSKCRETGIEFNNTTLINSAKILHTIKFINANS